MIAIGMLAVVLDAVWRARRPDATGEGKGAGGATTAEAA
jgi:hypothetical protein